MVYSPGIIKCMNNLHTIQKKAEQMRSHHLEELAAYKAFL